MGSLSWVIPVECKHAQPNQIVKAFDFEPIQTFCICYMYIYMNMYVYKKQQVAHMMKEGDLFKYIHKISLSDTTLSLHNVYDLTFQHFDGKPVSN